MSANQNFETTPLPDPGELSDDALLDYRVELYNLTGILRRGISEMLEFERVVLTKTQEANYQIRSRGLNTRRVEETIYPYPPAEITAVKDDLSADS